MIVKHSWVETPSSGCGYTQCWHQINCGWGQISVPSKDLFPRGVHRGKWGGHFLLAHCDFYPNGAPQCHGCALCAGMTSLKAWRPREGYALLNWQINDIQGHSSVGRWTKWYLWMGSVVLSHWLCLNGCMILHESSMSHTGDTLSRRSWFQSCIHQTCCKTLGSISGLLRDFTWPDTSYFIKSRRLHST